MNFDEISFKLKAEKAEGIYEASYDKFTQVGTYSVVIYAENPDGSAIPVEMTVEVPALKIESPLIRFDVDKGGEVDIIDMVLVASNFGQTITSPIEPDKPNPDVNGDGKVDIFDLVLLAIHFGEKLNPIAPKAAPVRDFMGQEDVSDVSDALSDVDLLTKLRDLLKSIPDANPGILKVIAELERLIDIAIAKNIPSETKLLANFPNPFNHETWIPYQLSEASEVEIRIYGVSGRLVRRLSLGHKEAGMYIIKERAAYWDGKNEAGERVASGVYFYQLLAGSFSAMRKMLVLK